MSYAAVPSILPWIAHEQQIQLMGSAPAIGLHRGRAHRGRPRWAVSAGHGLALGQDDEVFDLSDPENALELKHALFALAKLGADPLQSPDPIREVRWQEMIRAGDHAGSWDAASADELVAAIGRHAPASGIDGPYLQIGGSRFGIGIVGGPQPTAAGLEVIAGALEHKLGGAPAMSRYLAWRGGVFRPPSRLSMPGPGKIVAPSDRHGPFWDPRGYTPVWPEGDPAWVKAAADVDAALVACWQQLAELSGPGVTEQARSIAIDDCVLSRRLAHHQAALVANQGAPEPECPWPTLYDRASAQCRRPAGVYDLPPVDLSDEKCIQAYVELEGKTEAEARRLCGVEERALGAGWTAVVAAGAAIGTALWWWLGRPHP